VDYYRCEKCKVNWLCENCAQVCHKACGEVSVYIKGHKPTYACCYCARKSACCLKEKK
jgi:hypothetical protein